MRRYILLIAAFALIVAALGAVVISYFGSNTLNIPAWAVWGAIILAGVLFASFIGLFKVAKETAKVVTLANETGLSEQEHSHTSIYASRAVPPAPPQHFTGRAKQRETLARELSSGEWVVQVAIYGQSGLGKTTLAQKLAQDLAKAKTFPGGILWWTLGPQPDLLAAFSAWAATANPTADVTRLPRDVRPDFVRGQLSQVGRLCVILDDVREAESASTLIRALPPGTAVLLTTCDATLTGALNCSLHELPPLDENESVELLTRLLGSLENRQESAHEIARLAAGLPLALELAAGQINTLAELPVLAETLRQTPKFKSQLQLPGGEACNPGMEACLAANYAALTAPLQGRFRALGVFPAPFDEPALFATWDEADSTALDTLLRRRLLTRNETTGLLSQHALINVYASALLGLEPTEEVRVGKRHADYYLEQADSTKDRYSHGYENIHAILNQFHLLWPHLETAYARINSHGHTQTQGEMRWLCDFPEKIIYALDLYLPPAQMIAILETSLAAARRLGDKQSESIHLLNLGFAFASSGVLQQAIKYYELALPLKREIGDQRGEGKALGNLGIAYADLGEIRKAIEYHEQHLVIARETGDQPGQAAVLRNLGVSYASLGNSHRAIEYFKLALVIDRELGDRRNEGRSLGNLGLAYADRRDPQTAIQYYEEALKVMREIGDRRGEGSILGNLGIIYYALGDVYSSIEYYEQHLNITRLIGDRRGEGNALGNLGIAYKKLGDPIMAMEYYEQALEIDRATGDKLGEANDCWNMGLLFEEQGHLARAIELMQVRVDYLNSIGHTEASRYARYLEDLRRKMEEQGDSRELALQH